MTPSAPGNPLLPRRSQTVRLSLAMLLAIGGCHWNTAGTKQTPGSFPGAAREPSESVAFSQAGNDEGASSKRSSSVGPIMFRGDPAHRGQYPGPPPIGYGGILWRVQTGGPVRSTPAVADGRVFIGSGDGYVYALDVQSGRRLWRYQATTSVTGSPAVAEN